MRRIRLSLAAALGTVACAAACSSSPNVPSTSSSTPQSPGAPGGAGGTTAAAAPSAARSLSLTGDGHALHLRGAPADPAYVATYPITGFSGMTVTASAFGDLSAACESAGAATACKSLPFFAQTGGGTIKVFDPYGHVVLAAPAPAPGPLPGLFDAGTSPPFLPGWDAGVGSGLGIDAGGCAPSVTASLSGCTIMVDGVTCDCSDASCTADAIQTCLGNAGLPGAGGGLGGGIFDAGLPGIAPLPDGGPFGGAACGSAAIASAKAQFCSDVDAWLSANGISATLDCAAVGTLTFPTTLPAPSTSGFTCDQITHDAFVKVRTALATCNPLEYVGWDSSAELQLFEDSACTVW